MPLAAALVASQGTGGPATVAPLTGRPHTTPVAGSRKRMFSGMPGTWSAMEYVPSTAVVAVPTTWPLPLTTSTIQPDRRRSPLSMRPKSLPWSNHTVPDTEADNCTGVGRRHAFCVIAGSHTGRSPGLPSKSARSSGVGVRNSFSPPPSTITALFTGEPVAAAAATRTEATMVSAEVAPAAITVLLAQRKRLSPGAPVQVQPVPTGVAASVRPAGRRSSTTYSPALGCCPMLRTRSV